MGLHTKSGNIMMLEDIVSRAVNGSSQNHSALTSEVLALEGMSSDKVRHFLNNVCNFPTVRYLEVGAWKGSTFISAMLNNHISEAWIVENWSEFGGPKAEFQQNFDRFLSNLPNIHIIEGDFSKINLYQNNISDVNVYFYDGAHDHESQRLALTYLYPVLQEQFIFIVDDWNHEPARTGTYAAIKELNLTIHIEYELKAAFNGDRAGYWNGLAVFVLEKPEA